MISKSLGLAILASCVSFLEKSNRRGKWTMSFSIAVSVKPGEFLH